MDALEKLISEKKALLGELRERVNALGPEIAALELAARLRPASTGSTHAVSLPRATMRTPHTRAATQSGVGGGRKPGDISQAWRVILNGVYQLGGPVDYEMVGMVAKENGSDLALTSIRDRVRNFVKTGLMSGSAPSGFIVTKNAVEKFGFTKENGPPKGSPDAGGAPTPLKMPGWEQHGSPVS